MIDLNKANIHNLILKDKYINADVLRIDKIHNVVSGNKWFKLKNHIQKVKDENHNTILTFGGAYSNHIVATAYTAKEMNLNSIGIIRGEEPKKLSKTLKDCKSYGMNLKFISRSEFKERESTEFINNLKTEFGDFYIIPEGGSGKLGRLGAEDIIKLCDYKKYTHIMCAIGTGTMFFGIANSSCKNQEIIGIPVLKGMNDFLERNKELFTDNQTYNRSKIFSEYHFGGYAKQNKELLDFMNQLYKNNNLPTDFVYTAKLLYSFYDLLNRNYFPNGSNVLIIHSGGLQGNETLSDYLTY